MFTCHNFIEKKSTSCKANLEDALWLSHAHCVKKLLEYDSIRKKINAPQYQGLFEKLISPLHFALWYARAEIVSILIEGGADPHAIDCHGWDSCHFAAFSMVESYEKIKILLAVGAECTRKTKLKATALDIALSWNNMNAAQLLIAHNVTSDDPAYQKEITALRALSEVQPMLALSTH